MISVEQLIGDLLLRHNCVIIPSFGGFVAKPVSAQIDYQKGTMLPPGKSLLFNRQLINNDGLLINELSLANNLSFDEASREVKEKINSWNEALKTGGRIEIDRVGNLFFDDERNMCFEQDRFFNLLLESFGLGKVHFLTEEDVKIAESRIVIETPVTKEEPTLVVSREEAVSVEENKKVEAPIIDIKVPQVQKEEKARAFDRESNDDQSNVVEHPAIRRRQAWKYIAAVCILPVAFYSIWIPMKTDVLESGIISIKDFNPFHTSSKGEYSKKEFTKAISVVKNDETSFEDEVANLDSDKKHFPFKFDDDTYIQVNIPEKAETNSTDVIEPIPDVQETFSADGVNYIVGCFGDRSNAENLVDRLKANGMDARIYDNKNGLHRVTAGSALSNEAYHKIKVQADGLGFSGWKLN